jgi:SAM-dependent methyltransferase
MSSLYRDDAELYDIAFDWDVEEEVDWLLERLGPACRSVLEPGCGTGRMLVAFARRGVEVFGFDLSEPALAIARERTAPYGELATVVVADMAEFDLGRRFGGAICPINTLGHLDPAELAAHLRCMAQHLEPGAHYLAQVGLVDPDSHEPFAGSHWEASRGETTLKIDWVDEELDPASGRSVQRSRIEVLTGPRAGQVLEELHEMTAWTPQAWHELVARSPLVEAATYDAGRRGERPRVGPDATGGLLWHELETASFDA